MIRVIIGRDDADSIGLVRRRMFRQLYRASGIRRADMDNHGDTRFGLVESDRSGLLAFFCRHRRPLTGGAEDEKPLNTCADVKVYELAHDLFVDPYFLIERCDNRQKNSADHVTSYSQLPSICPPACLGHQQKLVS